MKNDDERDKSEADDAETDTEGHSMFLYEGARQMAHQHERDAQRAAREARLLKESKPEKSR